MRNTKLRWVIVAGIVVLIVAAIAAFVAYSNHRESVARNDDGDLTVRTSLSGQSVRLDLPRTGKVEHVAVWFHGQGGNENSRMNEDWLNALREEGWAIASSNFHGSSWGNADSVADTVALTRWVESETGVTPSLWIAGSMGGAISLNTMLHRGNDGNDPACWYGTMPVVDLTSVSNVPGAETELASVWPGGVPSGWNPIDNVAALPDATNYRVLASPDDTWVPASDNGQALVNALSKRSGVKTSFLETSGKHGDVSHFDAADLTAFAATCTA